MDIFIRVKVLESDGEIYSINIASESANISRDDLTQFSNGQKLFLLSDEDDIVGMDNIGVGVVRDLSGDYKWASEIEETAGGVFTGGYLGVMSKHKTDADGNFASGEEPTIQITGNNITYLVLDFDRAQDHYATSISVNGVVIPNAYNDTSIITTFNPTNYVELKFLATNRPFQPLELTALYEEIIREYEDEDVIDYSILRQFKNEQGRPVYSVISQSGKIKVVDQEGIYKRMYRYGVLQDNLKADVSFGGEKFGEYILTNCDDNYGSPHVEFDLTDKLLDWDRNIYKVNSYAFYQLVGSNTFNNITLEQALSMVLDDFLTDTIPTANIDDGYVLSNNGKYLFFDQETKNRFNNYAINTVIDNAQTLKDIVNKICEIALCVVFVSPLGNITIKYNEKRSEGMQSAIFN